MNAFQKQVQTNSNSKNISKKTTYPHQDSDDEINFDLDDASLLDEMDLKELDQSSRKSCNSITCGEETNKKSILVRNIDFESSLDEVEKLFSHFGLVNKVTMIYDKYTGKSKGVAYVEFESEEAKENSKDYHHHIYKSKVLKVEDKLKEIPNHVGRKEKCFNTNMNKYFSTTKNNFGPIKIKKSLGKSYQPY